MQVFMKFSKLFSVIWQTTTIMRHEQANNVASEKTHISIGISLV